MRNALILAGCGLFLALAFIVLIPLGFIEWVAGG
jgi:hypothetical protein